MMMTTTMMMIIIININIITSHTSNHDYNY